MLLALLLASAASMVLWLFPAPMFPSGTFAPLDKLLVLAIPAYALTEILLAALHSRDGLKAGRWEQIFRFDAQPARLPRKAASGVGPQLSDLAEDRKSTRL